MILKNKKILVTGADGFIGSHLTEQLVETGANVRALSYYNSFNSFGWLEDLDCLDDIEVVSGDIRDSQLCRRISKDIDVIFHLAALIGIPYSYIAPDSYIDTNVKGTLHICQAALENECERIIHTSTSEVYGSAIYVPIDEKHPLQPQSPYSASKIGADAIAESFFDSFNLPLTIARPFNTYGPRQSARAVIPTMIAQIYSDSKIIKLGDLSPTRDFNYVEDICSGFIKLAECEDCIGQVVNIGSNREISIRAVFDMIMEITRSDVEVRIDEARIRPEKSEVMRLWCDNTKICKLTDYNPAFDLRKGLEQTIEWFRDPVNRKKYKPTRYNI